MSTRNYYISRLMAILLVLALALPLSVLIVGHVPGSRLYGWVPPLEAAPKDRMAAYFDGSLQKWLEKYFDESVGLRATLLKTFNELEYSIFKERQNIELVWSDKYGLYNKLQADFINSTITDQKTLATDYTDYAFKARAVQELLGRKSIQFVHLIAASKISVLPYGMPDRYLALPAHKVIDASLKVDSFLQAAGVNSFDAAQYLRAREKSEKLPLYSRVGLHWNFYSGCLAASELDRRFRFGFDLPAYSCDHIEMDKAKSVDIDGLLHMNIWRFDSLRDLQPYPVISPPAFTGRRPSVLFIGDSFSDQVRVAMHDAGIYKNIDFSSYFQTFQPDTVTPDKAAPLKLAANQSKNFLKKYDLVILEMVDYNIPRYGYGFLDKVLQDIDAYDVPHCPATNGCYLIEGGQLKENKIILDGSRGIVGLKSPAKNWSIEGKYLAGMEKIDVYLDGVLVGKLGAAGTSDPNFALSIKPEIKKKGMSLLVFIPENNKSRLDISLNTLQQQ